MRRLALAALLIATPALADEFHEGRSSHHGYYRHYHYHYRHTRPARHQRVRVIEDRVKFVPLDEEPKAEAKPIVVQPPKLPKPSRFDPEIRAWTSDLNIIRQREPALVIPLNKDLFKEKP